MLSKSKIKFVRSLQLRKYRQKYHKIVVEGVKVVSDVLKESLVSLDVIYATDEWIETYSKLLQNTNIEVIEVTQSDIGKVSGFMTPQSVLVVGTLPECQIDLNLPQHHLCLYLDGVRDTGNLGTILRIADWFGYRNIYLSEDCADIYNPKVIQASMSSVFRVQCRTCSLADLVHGKQVPVLAAVMNGSPLDSLPKPTAGILVFGNESHGIRPENQQFCTHAITISAGNSLGAESLNIAAAVAVICAEFSTPQK